MAYVESLEARQLMALAISTYSVPTGVGQGSQPTAIVAGPDGNVWFTETFGSKIGRITTGGSVKTFGTTAGNAEDITVGPDNNLWFTTSDKKIGRMTTAGAVKLFTLPGTFNDPVGITKGPDGALWFTDFVYGKIGRITTTGTIKFYPLPTGASGISAPEDIVTGPDGALWFTASLRIGRITTAGAITSYAFPSKAGRGQDITVGPDKNIWFTNRFNNRIGKVNVASKAVTEYVTPTANAFPYGVASGIDGSLWYTSGDKLGKISTAGVFGGEQNLGIAANPRSITTGPDGNLWFTEGVQNKIAKGKIAGTISGIVFNDLDHDGVRDAGEGALAGVRVYLDGNGNNTYDAGEKYVFTDSQGRWSFNLLGGKTYTVRHVSPTGYRPTAPASGEYVVALAMGQTVSNKLFGDTRIA